MKRRGRLYHAKSLNFEAVEDVAFREQTRHGKFYENWFEEKQTITKREMVNRLAKQFDIPRHKAGLLLSWSLRDGISPEECFKKYAEKLTPKL